MKHLGELDRGIRLDSAKLEIANRIRHVCPDIDEAEFGALVDRMAEIEVRYQLRDDWGVFNAIAMEARSLN
jgi:hypothetical protein